MNKEEKSIKGTKETEGIYWKPSVNYLLKSFQFLWYWFLIPFVPVLLYMDWDGLLIVLFLPYISIPILILWWASVYYATKSIETNSLALLPMLISGLSFLLLGYAFLMVF